MVSVMSSEINVNNIKVSPQLQKGSKADSNATKIRLVTSGAAATANIKQSANTGNELPSISASNGNSPPDQNKISQPSGQQHKSVETEGAISREKIDSVVKHIESAVQDVQREVRFEVHDETGQTIISVLDRDTKEVLKQFPPEELLILAERIEANMPDVGLLIDREV